MIISIMLLLICSVIFMILGYKNKFYWTIILYETGICVLMFAMVLYTIKLSEYFFKFGIDYKLYLILADFKIGINEISRIYNVGYAIVELAAVVFVSCVFKIKKVLVSLCVLPIFVCLFFADPQISFIFYIKINTAASIIAKNNYLILYSAMQQAYIFFFIVYLIAPVFVGIIHYIKTKIHVRKVEALVSIFSILVIDIFVVTVFIIGDLGQFWLSNTTLLKFPVNDMQLQNAIIIPPMVVILIILILYLMLYYKPFDNLTILTKHDIVRNYKQLNKSTRMIFHSQKNMFFAINLLSHQALDSVDCDKDLIKTNLQKIIQISDESIANLSHTLNMMREICVKNSIVSLNECVDNALQKSILNGSKINVIKDYKDDLNACVDEKYIEEVFVNLLNNAAEALKQNSTQNPMVSILIEREDEYGIIEIYDNGCGINRKNIKKIYNPMFSTKQNSTNWGVGLNYVKKVLNFYRGSIHVKSKLGDYTKFQLVLPLLKPGKETKREQN